MRLWCTACKDHHDSSAFYRCGKSPSGFRSCCKAVMLVRQRKNKQARRKPRASVGLAALDAAAAAGRCFWRVLTRDACQRQARWRSTESLWQTCDEHRLVTDTTPLQLRQRAGRDRPQEGG